MNAKNHDIEGKYANNSLLCVMFSVKGKVVSSMEFCLWLLEETSASAAPTERPTWLFQAGRKNDFTRFYKILFQRRWGGRLTGRAELCKLATFQKNTLLSVAVSNSSVPKWLLRKPRFLVSASCAALQQWKQLRMRLRVKEKLHESTTQLRWRACASAVVPAGAKQGRLLLVPA